MSAGAASSSHASSSHSTARACARRTVKRAQPTTPDRGYGLIVDQTCLRKWATAFHHRLYGDALSKMTPEEVERAIKSMSYSSLVFIPRIISSEFPRIPRLHRSLILMNGVEGTYLLVLKDNSSEDAINTDIYSSDVEGVRKMLDLGDQRPKWYSIML
ncbi:hypothetical protein C8Q74DRAFT_1365163 [Fomes fomentarius]|nr:hypothetical protein C8Q74DRAFT_1365163 [Fomes fomentarius]